MPDSCSTYYPIPAAFLGILFLAVNILIILFAEEDIYKELAAAGAVFSLFSIFVSLCACRKDLIRHNLPQLEQENVDRELKCLTVLSGVGLLAGAASVFGSLATGGFDFVIDSYYNHSIK